MLIDTGSVFTIIHYNLFKEIETRSQSKILVAPCKSTVVSANSEIIDIHGVIDVNISIKGVQCKQTVLIAKDLAHQCLLGTDFMKKHNAKIDFNKMTISVDNNECDVNYSTGSAAVCRVNLKQTVCIPSGNEMLLTGKVKKKERGFQKTGTFLFEPKQRFENHDKVCAAYVLTEGKDSCITRVMNVSAEDVTMYKNTTVGYLLPVKEHKCKPSLEQQIAASGGLKISNCSMLEQQFAAPGTEFDRKSPNEMIDKTLEQQFAAPGTSFNIDSKLQSGEREVLNTLLLEYNDIFSKDPSDIGRTDLVRHGINTGNEAAIKQNPRRIPLHKKNEVKELIHDMLEREVIRPSSSPWSSPIVLVKKKDNSTRFCVDFRKVNEITKKDAYPIPRIDDTFDTLSGARFFSCVDMANGYWQVEVEENDKEKTAFSTPYGLYEFNVMPFGLTGAPGLFQRLMENVLKGLQFEICLIYLDDVVIFSSTFDEHVERLRIVFQRFRENGL